MAAYLLLQRKTLDKSLQAVLGVYSSWTNAYFAFYNRYRQGRSPFTLGRFLFHDKGMFEETVRQMDYNKTSIRIFESDFVIVDITKVAVDTQVG